MPDEHDHDSSPASSKGENGEGNYQAGREFQQGQREFAQDKGKVERAAREAADALDGPEAESLEQARVESAKAGGDQSPDQ